MLRRSSASAPALASHAGGIGGEVLSSFKRGVGADKKCENIGRSVQSRMSISGMPGLLPS